MIILKYLADAKLNRAEAGKDMKFTLATKTRNHAATIFAGWVTADGNDVVGENTQGKLLIPGVQVPTSISA